MTDFITEQLKSRGLSDADIEKIGQDIHTVFCLKMIAATASRMSDSQKKELAELVRSGDFGAMIEFLRGSYQPEVWEETVSKVLTEVLTDWSRAVNEEEDENEE